MLIPAWRHEFGLKLRYHVPFVHSLGTGHVVEIEEGEEALYPLADEWRVVPRAADRERTANPEREVPISWFTPQPYEPQGVSADVVICPRMREHGAGKNWPGWLELAGLPGAFAAGAPDSSFEVDCPRAWDHPRFLDATIEAMLSARLVIATTSGLSLLAVLCGRPLLLVTYRGLVAPGPIVHADGRVLRSAYRTVPLDRYYHPMNHRGTPIHVVDGWEDPSRVTRAVERILRC